jgi:microcystin-dependent protein
MSQPYVGEIRLFGGTFNPVGWAKCNGQLVPISENDVLFTLIGTTYGGDGQENFALPNMQSRVPLHQGNSFVMGQTGGAESVTLTTSQMPSHTHPVVCNSAGQTNTADPTNAIWNASDVTQYSTGGPTGQMFSPNLDLAGGNQPHENLQPYLCVTFIISLFGIFPTPN